MIFLIIYINLFLSIFVFFVDNDFLLNNGYLFFACQHLVNFYFLFTRVKFAYSLFMPSFLILVYMAISQIFGGYLLPKDVGWDKSFSDHYFSIYNLDFILFYLMLFNFILFCLSVFFYEKNKKDYEIFYFRELGSGSLIVVVFLFIMPFFLNIPWMFPLQLALIFLFFTNERIIRFKYKYFMYIFVILTMLVLNYNNKREIVMVVMSLIFLEFYINKTKIDFKIISGLSLVVFLSIVFVLIASILRGYGDLDNRNLLSAFMYLPKYIASDNFLDSFSDNFELTYTYAVSLISIDFLLNGRLDLQYGLSIIKPLFLLFPRSIFEIKPESIIMVFTKEYNYSMYVSGVSYPVVIPSEFFLNFHIFSLPISVFIFYIFNKIFFSLRKYSIGSVKFIFISYLAIMFFIFIRGSGLDLLIFNFFLGGTLVFIFKYAYHSR